ncbi:MAG TPA: MFS transporter [Jatrophihabitans sp.]|nr:MFS transporter [Jatrophihabitans sp.]
MTPSEHSPVRTGGGPVDTDGAETADLDSADLDSAGAEPAASPHAVTTLLMALGATFIAMMDSYIVNVAVPSIRLDLGSSSAAVEAMVGGYLLCYGVFLITGGRLGAIMGTTKAFLGGVTAFTLFSLACGLAPNTSFLIAFRCAQGLSAAVFFPQILVILQTTFAGRARDRALAYFGVTIGIAAIAGQIIGGLLLGADILNLSWRPIFLVNVPIGLLLVIVAARVLPRSQSTGQARLDLGGVVLLTAGLVAVFLPLTEGQSLGWPVWSIVLLALALPILAGFVAFEHRLAVAGGAPLLRPGLFAFRAFRAGNLTFLFFFAANAGFYFVLAQYLQNGLGYSALDSAWVFAALAVSFTAVSLLLPGIQARLGLRTLTVGYTLNAVGYALLLAFVAARGHGVGGGWIAPALVVIGIGQGLGVSPLLGAALGKVPPAEMGVAAGGLETVGQIGMTLGVAAIGSIYLARSGSGNFSGGLTGALVLATALAVLAAACVPSLRRGASQ